MCEYCVLREGKPPICKPLNTLCTFCALGNMKMYEQAKNAEKGKEP